MAVALVYEGETFTHAVYLWGFPIALFKTRAMAKIFCEQNSVSLSNIKEVNDVRK